MGEAEAAETPAADDVEQSTTSAAQQDPPEEPAAVAEDAKTKAAPGPQFQD